MNPRLVVFSPEARNDLIELYDWIAETADPQTAITFIERIEKYCNGFSHASERGQARNDIRPNLRIIGFERRLTIAFTVTPEQVVFLRVFYRGKNWEAVLY